MADSHRYIESNRSPANDRAPINKTPDRTGPFRQLHTSRAFRRLLGRRSATDQGYNHNKGRTEGDWTNATNYRFDRLRGNNSKLLARFPSLRYSRQAPRHLRSACIRRYSTRLQAESGQITKAWHRSKTTRREPIEIPQHEELAAQLTSYHCASQQKTDTTLLDTAKKWISKLMSFANQTSLFTNHSFRMSDPKPHK